MMTVWDSRERGNVGITYHDGQRKRGTFVAYRATGGREMIAALFVENGGVYYGLPWVDPWDEKRDARLYPGPFPVIAHPPCARWGRYWSGGPSARVRRLLGDDGGCFKSALEAVRKWGGVVEHPEGSHAWRKFGLVCPPKKGGWVSAGIGDQGYTCCVEQGNYGHRGRKATWLYVVGCNLISLKWGKSSRSIKMEDSYHSADERKQKRLIKTGICQRLSKRERSATPIEFRDILLSLTETKEPAP
jgi:hypothetical protein